jgi:integrase
MGSIHRLSPAKVRSARPGWHCDGGGLYLRVTEGASGLCRSWVFRWAVNGRERYHGLGPIETVSLADARDAALACRKMVREGGDPIATRKAQITAKHLAGAQAMTFTEAAKQCIASHSAGWRNAKHGAQWITSLATYAEPVIGRLPVQAIDTALVLKVLEPIWTTVPETASRVRGRVEAVLDWASARGLRQGENPARWKGHLSKLLPARSKVRAVRHHAALPYAEIAQFMAGLRGQDTVSGRALEFAILTAARSGEALGACWDEINFATRTWTIPGSRMKRAVEHRVPLSDRAIEILQKLFEARTGDRIFPGRGGSIGPMALLQLLARMGYAGKITPHGFRSTFRDWAAEQTAYPRDVCEQALAHAVGDKTEAAYKRTDLFEKRRRLMADWAEYCAMPATEGEVVPLKPAVAS